MADPEKTVVERPPSLLRELGIELGSRTFFAFLLWLFFAYVACDVDSAKRTLRHRANLERKIEQIEKKVWKSDSASQAMRLRADQMELEEELSKTNAKLIRRALSEPKGPKIRKVSALVLAALVLLSSIHAAVKEHAEQRARTGTVNRKRWDRR